MSQKIEIILDDHCANLIHEEVATGKYANASDFVHQAISLLEKQNSLNILENLIQIGEESGIAKDFNRHTFIDKLKNIE